MAVGCISWDVDPGPPKMRMLRGAFDLSPKAEPDQMERPGRAGSILGFCRFCLTQNRWSSAPTDLLPIRRSGQNGSWYLICYQKLDDFVRQKQGFLRQVLLCLVVRSCFHFGWRNFLNFSPAFVVSPAKTRGKQRQCADLSSAVATWSSSPNLIIVSRTPPLCTSVAPPRQITRLESRRTESGTVKPEHAHLGVLDQRPD